MVLCLGLTLGSAAAAVGPGFSLLMFQPGTPQFVDFPGIGAFEVVGAPIGPGSTDTIIQTFGDADPYGGFNAEVVGHALRSIKPVSISDHEYDVFVNLDPSRPSTGYLYVRSIGFTDASFHLFLNVSLVEGGVTVLVLPFDVNVGAMDEPILPMPPGYPEDPRYPSNGFFGELGFFGFGEVGYMIHPLVAVPEPANWVLLVIGLFGLGLATRWRPRPIIPRRIR